jgi:putative DNA primase/helicase
VTDNSTQTDHSTLIFWHAPEIAKAGYKVFPIKGKAPSVAGGFYAATTDLSQLAEWIQDGRGDHDIAIPTGIVSDVVVIDADSPETYAAMEERYGPPTVKTKRGGHWWFRHPRKGKVGSTNIRTHLDRKGDGGYVVVPPSRGRTWTDGIPEKDALPVLPDELREEKRDTEPSGGSAPTIGAPIPEGQRNVALTSDAGAMRRRGMDEEAIFAALQITNRQRCTPPLDEGEVRSITRSVANYPPAENVAFLRVGNQREAGESEPSFSLTDTGNAERLVKRHGQQLRYCHPWRAWLVQDGKRWRLDDSGEVVRRAKETGRSIYGDAAKAQNDGVAKSLGNWAKQSLSEARIKSMIELAKSEVPVTPGLLDADPWLFNVENGTLDLRTGGLREHRRDDFITKIAPVEYDPSTSAPTWQAALERVLPNPEIRAFFKRLCGYALTGDTSEHILLMLYGTGANGKSTVLNALLDTFGDYGTQAAPDLLVAKKGAHPTELADLFGMRLVSSIEVEDGRRLAESLVKQLTGGDRIKARRMRQDFWEFSPTHKVFMAVNHKPTVRGTDNAIWRRIRLIPFTETIPPAEQDKKLRGKLRTERAGILAWAVEGCLEWQRKGLQAPDEVRKATVEYRAEMDVLGAFLNECCEKGAEHSAPAKDLYEAYRLWCDENGERYETQRRFAGQLKDRGTFERRRSGPNGSYQWHGLRLLNLWKAAICRKTEPTEPKVTINSSKNTPRGEIGNKGSEGSEGSAKGWIEP